MADFKKVSGQGKIVKYTESKPGDIMIENGEFVGTSQNQYGTLYNFQEVDTGEGKALPGCGQLNYMYEQATLKVGYRYQVVYQGKKKLDSGPYKGKECNDVDVYEDKSYTPAGTGHQSPSPQPPKQSGDMYDDSPV